MHLLSKTFSMHFYEILTPHILHKSAFCTVATVKYRFSDQFPLRIS